MRKLILTLFLWLFIAPAMCAAETADYASLPQEGAAPYAPVAEAFSADGMGYDDGTLSIRIEQDVAFDTNIYYIYIQLTDPSQFRTALARPYPSKEADNVAVMAAKNNAVLAINGEYFAYHSSGYVVRGGKLLRNNPDIERDLLIVDENGDFHFILSPRAMAIEAFEGVMKETFNFGPALIENGEVLQFKYNEKTSCGYPTKAQRLAICQLDTLSYLIVATEGPEQDPDAGLTIPELVQLLTQKDVRYAYNLDGGSSTTVLLNGQMINAPDSKRRLVGDIIYFATLIAP
ncbi:MAG TPA: phosphodiester glycosidase family protein [Candidatus Limiplasma sp.]|nr:phosphodiester glycosidase family protein [Candidatus Limiplasma sp.]HRX09138.1 phosphodiester glycosidase family protein [Candidatus Limiplasma sp.]